MNKSNKNEYIDTENRVVVTRGRRLEGKVKRVNCLVTDGK